MSANRLFFNFKRVKLLKVNANITDLIVPAQNILYIERTGPSHTCIHLINGQSINLANVPIGNIRCLLVGNETVITPECAESF